MIPVTQQDFRAAINKYGAISMLFRIGPEWWTAKNGKASWAQADIDPLRPPHNDVVGGHQLVGMGFRTNIERLLNHWSADWADGGESDYLFNEQKPYIVEALAIAEVPNDTLKLVQSLPAPNDFKHNFAVDLKYGQNNFETRALQIALAIDGWANFEEITGYYGTVTANAVLAFQLKYNVAPTSELNQLKGRSVGPATRKQLNLLFNK